MSKKLINKNGIKMIGDFKVPEWWECGWRRVSCNKLDCKLCGRILRDRQRHIEKGEDPDDWKCIFEDVGNSFKETMEMIKKDAKRMGINLNNLNDSEDISEPPEPNQIPFYRKVVQWQKFIEEIIKNANTSMSLWLASEAAANLMWYKNILLSKTYRQLCNRFELDRGDQCADIDYIYTKYVLTECLKILKKSLQELSLLASEQKAELILALTKLIKLEKEILTI